VVLAGALLSNTQAYSADVEVSYATQFDPNNKNDPRSAAQAKLIEAFERENPNIKIKVVVDPTGALALRAVKAKAASPDVFKIIGYSVPEYVATGGLLPLDDMIAREKINGTDWLLPFRGTAVDGKMYALVLDYRIPILVYRKSLLEKAGVKPPKTWNEVCESGGKISKLGVIGYPVGIGAAAGLGGAQAFAEFQFSSMITEGGSPYFDKDGRKLLFTEDQFVRAASTIRDLFTKCGASPNTTIQFSYNEVHDGLRAGTIGMATFGVFRFGAIVNGGAGDDLGWAPAPAYDEHGKQTVYGYQAAINANSANKAAAEKFLTFVASEKGQKIALEGGEVVARQSAYNGENPYLQTAAGQRQAAWAKLVTERGVSPIYPIQLTLYNQILGEVFQRILLKGASLQEGYKELTTRYNEALKSAQ
jgi:multiple sugar transport system substrate-binding protein